MVTINYQGEVFSVEENETVLETLLKKGVKVANSCRAGVCQSCILKAEKTCLPAEAQNGLKETLKTQGYFLSCMYRPQEDLTIVSAADLQIPVYIADKEMLNQDVLCLKLKYEDEFAFQAGQFINLIREDGLARSYSIASLPSDGYLALHIRLIANGQMSGWLSSQAKIGEKLYIQGPKGDCFYLNNNKQQPLLMVGTGTGLAPLYGILQDALKQGHDGEIHLFHGALKHEGIYLKDELYFLSKQYSHFYYHPSVLQGETDNIVEVGAINQLVFKHIPKLKGWRAFLCGHPELVNSLKKQVFLAGVSSKDIYSDAFFASAN